MPYEVRGRSRAAAWCGRLLLFAALIVGIVGMHTLGHPVGGHGSGPMPAAHQTHQTYHAPQSHHGPHTHHVPQVHHALPTHHALQAPQQARYSSSVADDHHAMNPGAACLAVLSLCVLVLVRTGRLLGRQAADLLAAVRARLLRGLRPLPPPLPRHKHLARLSVLRV
ncbi:hypothetical protein OEIGOIKO_06002 [Streptomyces chrestomyceticus JCM 4735]|uniref:Uncharacterized protein n=2 Tax=Streptomyces chrestomyceticus TaxID=68185 RepID=A0A7U9L0E6_9ACTN|nr:hypothetical protein OEIGOIKO_06002 [Streptomyces chrestomyceticus JCM 4735]